MDTMPLTLDWPAVVTRLALAVVAGAAFGFNRSDSGKPAGLRTTLLVCLAACLSMLQANALVTLSGKHPDSFAQLDLMRLPLGVLTGMGFIGAGAVLRKDGLVTGVTTAATLWFVTMIGLTIGGGQYRLAILGTVLGLGVLWGLRYVEERLERRKSAWLVFEYEAGSDCAHRIATDLRAAGCSLSRRSACWRRGEDVFEERLLVRWREQFDLESTSPRFVELARRAGAQSVQWAMIE
ncbi:MgtC/SapB family protein [Trinickia caryophylli]|nr:MgtC/SapB family protein [Trinickia caryophylli]PMS13092.1 MgtC/SapB family protein [Trinickia caryophylli]TRX14727.1 MgtC/SapB family protein [Trinickia caryophylli]WQE14570.1 MgtC/SapB family protein [Trinickia caryophylli]